MNCAKCGHPAHKAGECKQNVPPEPHMPAWTGKRCKCDAAIVLAEQSPLFVEGA